MAREPRRRPKSAAGDGGLTPYRGQPGVWQISVELPIGPDGKRRRSWKVIHGTHREALDARAVMRSELTAGRLVTRSDMTVAELVALVLRAAKIAASTKVKEQGGAARLGMLGDMKITAVKAGHVRARYAEMEDAGLKPASIAIVHQALSRAFNQAAEDKMIGINPMATVKKPTVTTTERDPVTRAEISKVLGACLNPTDTLLFQILAQTGMRRGEALGLQWSRVDLARRRIDISHALTVVDKAPVLGPTKTRNVRTIPITEELRLLLRRARAAQLDAAMAQGLGQRPLWVVSATPAGVLPLAPGNATNRWRKACARAGVIDRNLHGLRHRAATSMLEDGLDPVTAAKYLGWSSTKEFLDRYAHTDEDRLIGAAQSIGRGAGSRATAPTPGRRVILRRSALHGLRRAN